MKHRTHWTLWDADDTLLGVEIDGEVVGTAMAYTHILDRYAKRMQEIGFSEDAARSVQHEMDDDLCRRYGFADKGRFSYSLQSAYRTLCGLEGRAVSDQEVADLKTLGDSVFTFPYRPLPGAMEVLSEVQQHYNVAVVTKGDPVEQRKKLFDSGLFVYADQTLVLVHKNVDEWEAVLAALRIDPALRARSWAIGNSVKSDVNPPLALGLNAIHLERQTWAFEDASYATPQYGRALHTIHDLREALPHLALPRKETPHG